MSTNMTPSNILLVYRQTKDLRWELITNPGIPIAQSSPLITNDFDDPPPRLLITLAADLTKHASGHPGMLSGFELYSCWKSTTCESKEAYFNVLLMSKGDRGSSISTCAGQNEHSKSQSSNQEHDRESRTESTHVAHMQWGHSESAAASTSPDRRSGRRRNSDNSSQTDRPWDLDNAVLDKVFPDTTSDRGSWGSKKSSLPRRNPSTNRLAQPKTRRRRLGGKQASTHHLQKGGVRIDASDPSGSSYRQGPDISWNLTCSDREDSQ